MLEHAVMRLRGLRQLGYQISFGVVFPKLDVALNQTLGAGVVGQIF